MPQMNKGGKFIFGKSLIRENLTIHLPTQALTEYDATAEGESIRSSDIAFTMGATGPLLERADNYEGEIPLY